MTLLITVFLVLVNIFNSITTNIPKAEGLTAIEAWVIVCVLFVFGALVGKLKTASVTAILFYSLTYCRVCWNSIAIEDAGVNKENAIEEATTNKSANQSMSKHAKGG
jgi:hypothetical protein